jgi:YVTN family beta-propeller protein
MSAQSLLLRFVLAAVPAGLAFSQTTAATFGKVIALGGTPSDVVVDELRDRLYLVNANANRVDVFSIGEKRVTGNILVGRYPLSAAMSMDGSRLYVTNTQSASLSVIDLGTDQVMQTVSLPARPEGVASGVDGRVLITTQGTGVNNASNTLLIYDPNQQQGQQVSAVLAPPPITTPNPLPQVFVGRPATPFPGRLLRTPDGQFIIGMVAINQTANNANTTLFVYEVQSGVVLKNRTVTGQSTVLSLAHDGSRFMAGSTLYDTTSLSVIAQQSTSNLPFIFGPQGFNPGFQIGVNYGGSAFSQDGATLYTAFNTSPAGQRVSSNVLFVNSAANLGARLGIRLPESIIGKIVTTGGGSEAWALSESGMINLPLSTLYDYPILQPETTQVFLAVDECNKGVARAQVRVSNLGKGRLSYAIPNVSTALVMQASTGLAPSTITFIMEPGRSGVTRQPGTNLFTGAGGGGGSPINVNLTSLDAINFPSVIRVYMNYRQPDQRGIVYPLPTALNNSEGLVDLVLDEARGRLYLSNSGYNRIEVFDIKKLKFLAPVEVGQLPRSMALTPDGYTLFVGNSGGESISQIDLETMKVTAQVDFPPIPRAGNQNAIRPLALAYGLSGLQFMMSNGTFWRLVGNTATPRVANTVTPVSIPGPLQMIATPGGEYILTLAGNGNAYLYDALADTYTASRQLYNQTPVSYFGPLGAGTSGSYYLAGGMILSPSLAVVGGTERPGVTTFQPPPAPGQPPLQVIVSSGQRNVAAVYPINENVFVRMTTPVRQNINAATRDDARPVMELVDIRTGSETVAGIAPENPIFSVFGTQRINVPPRQMVIDSKGTTYSITLSGLSVIPVSAGTVPPRPTITGGSRGIVNSADGTPNFKPGSFITVNGRDLGSAASAETIPLPTVLGGSCVIFNEVPLPLIQTSTGQISAQIPEDMRPGVNVVQVRNLMNASSSDPVVVTVQRP